MKIFLFILIILNSLLSKEIEQKAQVIFNISDQSKIIVDCSTSYSIFFKDNLSKATIEYCKRHEDFSYLPWKETLNKTTPTLKEIKNSGSFMFEPDDYFTLEDFINNEEFFLRVGYKNFYQLVRETLVFESFEVVVNSPNRLDIPTYKYGKDISKYKKIVLFKAENINYFEAIEKAKNYLNTKIIFSNTYDIGSKTECIEGLVFAKDYKINTNVPCDYISLKTKDTKNFKE